MPDPTDSAAMAIERASRRDSTWLILPPRVLPPAAGWVMAGFGLLTTGFMVFWIGSAAGWRLTGDTPGAFKIIQLLFAALGLPGLAITVGILVAGIGQLRGWVSRCEVGIGERAVLVRERFGRLYWTRAVPLAELRAILVDTAAPATSSASDPASRFRERLVLRRAARADLTAGHGYPPDLLHALAAALQAGLSGEVRARLGTSDPSALGPPPGTLAVEEANGRIAILLQPPRREWPLAIFAGGWLAGTGFCTWVTLFSESNAVSRLAGLLFLIPFWAIGIGLMLWFVHRGWGRVDLLWSEQQLSMIHRSPLRRRIRSWSRDDLSGILLAERGSGSGRYRAVTLQARHGADDELPRHPDEAANAWIAARLRLALTGVDPTAEAARPIIAAASAPTPLAAFSTSELPAGSRVVIRDSADGLTVTMPPAGLVGGRTLFIFALTFGAAGLATGAGAALRSEGPLALFAGIFALVSAVLILFGLHFATRRATITLGRDGLVVVTANCLHQRRWSRPLADIATIQVEDSGGEVNNRTVWHAAAVDRAGQRCTWGSTTDPSELAVITARLRVALERRAR